MNKKVALVAIGVFAIIGALAVPASAADETNVIITGGSLSITNPTVADFSGVTLDGQAQSATATMDGFSATDARATGAGWNVTVGASQFAEWDGTQYVASGHTLPASSLSMPQVSVAKGSGTSSALPSITTGPYTIDSGSSVEIASAAADGSGMGDYDFTQGGSLTLSVPASAYATTYRSTVTVSVATGP